MVLIFTFSEHILDPNMAGTIPPSKQSCRNGYLLEELKCSDEARRRKALERLVAENKGLIGRVLKIYRVGNEEMDDELFLAGCRGLITAALHYQHKGYSFSTYATHWIRDSIQKESLALRGKNFNSTVSLDAPVSGEKPQSLGEALSDDDVIFLGKETKESSDISSRMERTLTGIKIRDAVEALPEKQKDLIKLRYGFDGEPQRIQVIAQLLDLTLSKLKVLERRANNGLRQQLESVL